MADDMPIFPKASDMVIHSGNIVNWNRLKRKPSQTPADELAECIGETLHSCLSKLNKNELQYITSLVCIHPRFKEAILDEERDDLKLTGKIFLSDFHPAQCLQDAVTQLLAELETTFIETILLSFPELPEEQELALDQIRPYWKVLEELVEAEVVLSIGICDLSKNQLQDLFEWAKVKPCSNQVNLASCCVMPLDLTEYARENDIQLLTHGDPKDILSQKSFQDVIRSNSTERDSLHWSPVTCVRYTSLVKCRGIIRNKGYIVKAIRDLKKRK